MKIKGRLIQDKTFSWPQARSLAYRLSKNKKPFVLQGCTFKGIPTNPVIVASVRTGFIKELFGYKVGHGQAYDCTFLSPGHYDATSLSLV